MEEFGFGQGPVFRPDLATRSPDLVNAWSPGRAHDPAIRLAAAGCGGLFALGLTPRLNQPATKAMLASRAKASPFCGPRQIFALLPPKRPDREGVLRAELAHASPSSRPPDADLARASRPEAALATARRLWSNRVAPGRALNALLLLPCCDQ